MSKFLEAPKLRKEQQIWDKGIFGRTEGTI